MSFQQPQQQQQTQQQPQQVKLTKIQILDQSSALNVLVGFVSLAHSRGVFDLEESAKIWECIRQFQPQEQAKTSQTSAPLSASTSSVEELSNISFP